MNNWPIKSTRGLRVDVQDLEIEVHFEERPEGKIWSVQTGEGTLTPRAMELVYLKWLQAQTAHTMNQIAQEAERRGI